jgi:hypothetical protein
MAASTTRGIGAPGLSSGPNVLFQIAGRGCGTRRDGPGWLEDTKRRHGLTAIRPFLLAEFTTVTVTSGSKPPPARLAADREQQRGGRPICCLPDVSHTGAIRHAAPEQRATRLVNQSLRKEE